MSWQVHWLEATADLSSWRETIAHEIEATRDHLAGFMPPPRLDILVQRIPGGAIPEIGMVGHAWRAGLFALTVDPDNPHFDAALSDGTLRRQVAHEVHHSLRMAGLGYGRTLGEALVSEGLAGRFTQWLFGNPPEPWECAVDASTLLAHAPDAAELDATDYDHHAWFFGTGGKRPRWLGYTMGYAVVQCCQAARERVGLVVAGGRGRDHTEVPGYGGDAAQQRQRIKEPTDRPRQ